MKHKSKTERKVYPMKFTKFIPLVLALALTCPAFAAASDSATSEQTITVSPFINITKKPGAVETATATFDDAYSNITITPLSVTFNVITNDPTDKVYLTATALENSAQVKCLGGAADSLKIVFTNTSVATGSPTGAIENALSISPVLATNKDAIAFTFTPTLTPSAESGMAAAPTPALASNVVTYSFSDAGSCDFAYTSGTTQVANTFDTHDTAGTYKATLSMTHAAP